MIIFHGTDCELRPEDFDFDIADKDSDFGKAMYFGMEYDQAFDWASHNEKGVVNYYLLPLDEIFNDPSTKVLILDDQME